MIEIEDIKNRDSLREWLTDWPKENGLDADAARAVAVTIAHRAAMRVLPVWWDWTLTGGARKVDLTALPILRCDITSGTMASSPSPEINIATALAAGAADSGAAYARFYHATAVEDDFRTYGSAIRVTRESAAYAAAYAATTTAGADSTAAPDAAAATATAAATAATSAAIAIWKSVQFDCNFLLKGRDVRVAPLWPNWENPLGSVWGNVKDTVAAPEWSFWIKWYEDALAGTPPNWDMLEQIALIESEVWEEGVEAVAEKIAEILDAYGPDGDQSDANATPELALARNSKVIRLQLDTLMVFVEDEIQRLRGSNDIPESVMARITLLEEIVDAVKAMQSTLTDKAQPGGTALTVIEEKLPQIFETADELAKQDGSSEVSETVVVMAATIAHLTKCGTPAYAATGIAVADMVIKTIKSWLSRSKPSTD